MSAAPCSPSSSSSAAALAAAATAATQEREAAQKANQRKEKKEPVALVNQAIASLRMDVLMLSLMCACGTSCFHIF